MTIEYALTRSEIVRSYLQSLARSRRLLFTVLIYSAIAGMVVLLLRHRPSKPLGGGDIVGAVAASAAFLFLMPVTLWLRGKTAKRTLTVAPEGISTQIGSMEGRIPWQKIRVVQDAGEFILIARTNGNSFLIPNRAFSGHDQRTEFLSQTTGWLRGAR